MPELLPSIEEVAAGTFLHDIGKLLQRADVPLSGPTRNLESVLLPTSAGSPTHRHVLWTEAFFDWMNGRGLRFPGMDRRRDESTETSSRKGYARTPLLNPFAAVNLGAHGASDDWKRASVPLEELRPGESVFPRSQLDVSDYPERYRRLWERMKTALEAAFALPTAGLFQEVLLSISERFLFAVPSSTMDRPDISLHDHNRAAAAVAAAMHRWHTTHRALDPQSIRDRNAPKYRFVSGDLSGIQDALFRLASQQVRGAARILRARSFVMSSLLEGPRCWYAAPFVCRCFPSCPRPAVTL